MTTRPRLSAFALLLAALALPGAGGAQEGAGFVPTGLLTIDSTQSLDGQPLHMIALDTALFLTEDLGGTGRLSRLSPDTLVPEATAGLAFVPQAMTMSYDGSALYVLGPEGEGSVVLILDQDLDTLGKIALPRVTQGTLSSADNNRLLVAGLPPPGGEGLLLAFDVSDPAAPQDISWLVPASYNLFGIAGAWLDETHAPTLFLSTGLLPTLVAVEVGGKAAVEQADISFADDGANSPPLTTLGIMPARLCRDERELAAFLFAPKDQQSLYLATYDPDFQSLDVVSRSEFALPMQHEDEREIYEGTDIARPDALLASACDLGVILVSDRHAREVEQFAVNPQAMALEKVGEIALPGLPDGLAITDSGRAAYVLSKEAKTITRLHSGSDFATGTEENRNLQRLLTERGFPVGAIDGQIGVKTLTAVQRFEAQTGMTLDIRGDLGGALEAIQSIPLK